MQLDEMTFWTPTERWILCVRIVIRTKLNQDHGLCALLDEVVLLAFIVIIAKNFIARLVQIPGKAKGTRDGFLSYIS